MIRLVLPLTCAALPLCAAISHAHHSPAAFDMSRRIVVDGTVAKLEWKNPHSYLVLETTGEDGRPQLREVELAGIATVQTTGLQREHLAPGTHVVVTGSPHRRDPAGKMIGSSVTLDDGSVYAMNPGAAAEVTLEPAQSLAGLWAPRSSDFIRLATTVPTWPLTAAARAAQADPRAVARATASCEWSGGPTYMVLQVLRAIEIGEREVTITIDSLGVRQVRTVHLNEARHPDDVEPSLLGYSLGHWEGDALVIDTRGFAPDPAGIGFGVPSGAGKRMVERLALAADRRHIEYSFTLEDPEYLAEPVSFSSVWEHRPELSISSEAEPCDPEIAARFLEDLSVSR